MNSVFMLNTLNWAGDDHMIRPGLGCWTSREAAQGYIDEVFEHVPYAANIVEVEINNPSSEVKELQAKIESLYERIEELKDENSRLEEENDQLRSENDHGYNDNGMRRRDE